MKKNKWLKAIEMGERGSAVFLSASLLMTPLGSERSKAVAANTATSFESSAWDLPHFNPVPTGFVSSLMKFTESKWAWNLPGLSKDEKRDFHNVVKLLMLYKEGSRLHNYVMGTISEKMLADGLNAGLEEFTNSPDVKKAYKLARIIGGASKATIPAIKPVLVGLATKVITDYEANTISRDAMLEAEEELNPFINESYSDAKDKSDKLNELWKLAFDARGQKIKEAKEALDHAKKDASNFTPSTTKSVSESTVDATNRKDDPLVKSRPQLGVYYPSKTPDDNTPTRTIDHNNKDYQGVINQMKPVLNNGASSKTTVTVADDGKKISLTVGAQLEVRFRQPGGSGFQWVIAKNDPSVLKLQDGYPKFESGRGVGGGLTQVFLFDVQAAGSTDLVLEFKKPWENLPAVRKFSLSVVAATP